MTRSGHSQINFAVLHNAAARQLLPERERATVVPPDDVEQVRVRGTDVTEYFAEITGITRP
jgi:hypothetical protein